MAIQYKIRSASTETGYAKEEHRVAPETVQASSPAPATIQKHKGGRPSTGFDKKAYMSAFMRDKRKADKLGLKVSEYRASLKGEDK